MGGLTVDVMFLTHNRLRFTSESFRALIANTDWKRVHHLWIVDDNSTDGTYEYLLALAGDPPPNTISLLRDDFGGPVNAMNTVFDQTTADIVAKIDNDLIVPPGWLATMRAVMERNPHLDALGTEPGFAQPVTDHYGFRAYTQARHIGGQGLFRTRAFQRRRPTQNDRFFGLTQFMRTTMNCGWVDPDIASFNLDHLPFEPWRTLAAEYVENGWSREWSKYDKSMSAYWDWWVQKQQEAAA